MPMEEVESISTEILKKMYGCSTQGHGFVMQLGSSG